MRVAAHARQTILDATRPERDPPGGETADAPTGGAASLDSVLITPELERRAGRAPDYERQARSLDRLAMALAEKPGDALQVLTDIVVELCDAGSAGISLSREGVGRPEFEWVAVSGAWAQYRGGRMPLDASPCGVVVERNAALLFAHPEQHFPAANVDPLIAEILLVPFHLDDRPVGTVWAIAHDPARKFDREDVRLLLSLGRSAATMVQATQMLAALRESDDRLRAVIGELRHRTRNLFSLAQAIAHNTARSSRSLEDFVPRFSDRMASLARAEDLLFEERDGVTFRELLRAELSGLGAFEGGADRIAMAGPPEVVLPPETVQTLALALHELGTNALKHGALRTPGARLAVGWSVGPAGDRLDVEWKESGVAVGPDDEARERRGDGRRLIEEVLPRQLQAETRFDLEDDGLRCSISLRLGPDHAGQPPAA